MTSLEQPASTGATSPEPPRGMCPRCGRLGVNRHLATTAGIATATYLCERGHIWLTKWATDA